MITKNNHSSPPSTKANLKQLAEMTGVSMMTVSRALRGDKLVAEKTAKKILKAAEQIRYRPNRLVLGMRSGRTDLLAAIMPAGFGFYGDVLCGVEDRACNEGKGLLLNLVKEHRGPDAKREELRKLHRCIEMRVDGIILRPVNDDANAIYFNEVVERGVPIVVVDRELPDFPSDFVGTDNFAGGRDAARHLIKRGCRNLLVAYAGRQVSTSRDRLDGFIEHAKSAGVAVAGFDFGQFHPEQVMLDTFFAKKKNQAYDGIFAVGDHLARIAISALERNGILCPGQVKVVGFGNLPVADSSSRRITTFDQNPREMGECAVRLLLQRCENKEIAFQRILVPHQLVKGQTT